MLFTLFSKEIRQHLLTFRFAAALITTMLLVVLSLWVLGDDYLRRRDAYNLAVENAAQENQNVYVPSEISPMLSRPPSSLSIFAQGEDRRFGNSARVRRWQVPRRAETSFTDNMLMAAEPALDLFTIFSIVLSLFGLLFSYDAISGERERGTLKMICSGQVGRSTIYFSKFLAGIVSLAIPFLVSFICGLLLLTTLFNITFTAGQWLNIFGMVAVGLLYGALFIAFGLACSALFRRSATALVLSLLIWVVGVLLIPSAAQSIGKMLSPIDSAAEISNLEKVSIQEAKEQFEVFKKRYPRYWSGIWTGGFSVRSDGGGYIKYDGSEKDFSDAEEFTRFVEPLMIGRANRIWNAYLKIDSEKKRQQSLVDWLSVLSPAFHLRNSFTRLAGTDFSGYENFLENLRQYRRQMIDDFENRGYFTNNALAFFTRRKKSEISDAQYTERRNYYRQQMQLGRQAEEYMGPDIWGSLPSDVFPTFKATVETEDVSAIYQSLIFLAVSLAVVFSIGLIAFIRYDIR